MRRDDLVLGQPVIEPMELPQPEADAHTREEDDEHCEADPANAQQEAEHTMTVVEPANDGAAGWSCRA